MKRIIIFIVTLVVLVVIFTSLVLILPNVNKTYNFSEYNLSFKIPYAYRNIATEEENILLSLYNEETEIGVSFVKVQDDFWSSGDTEARMDEYLRVISAANYDSGMKNVKLELMDKLESKFGKVEFELEKPNESSRAVVLIANGEVGNIVFEINASKENYEENLEEINKIIDSVNVK